MEITLNMHNIGFAIEGLKKQLDIEKHRPEEVRETLERFQKIWDKMAKGGKYEGIFILEELELL